MKCRPCNDFTLVHKSMYVNRPLAKTLTASFHLPLLSHPTQKERAIPESCVEYLVQVVQIVGGRGHLDIQPHWVTVLAFPQHKGLMEGCMGLTTDTLLVGRLDGSVAMIDIVDSSSFRRSELQHCSRKDGLSCL